MPASYNDLLADPRLRDHVGEVWYQRTVRVPRGWSGWAGPPVPRVGHAPRHRVGRRRGGGPARGRLHAVRGRRHRAGAGGRAGADHGLRRQHAEFPDHPARRRRAERRQGPSSGTGTTSTTMRGCTARSGWPAHRRPGSRTSPSSPVSTAPPARSATGWTPPARTGSTCASCCATSRAARSAPPPAPPAWSPCPTSIPGRPATDTCTTWRSSWSTRTAGSSTATTRASACGRSRSRRRVPHQRRAVPVHRVRHARGPPDPRQGPQPRVPRAGLRAAGVDRGQLVPDVALPLLRGRPRPRRPARHRGDRRDRGRRAQHGSGRRHLRRAGLPDLQ